MGVRGERTGSSVGEEVESGAGVCGRYVAGERLHALEPREERGATLQRCLELVEHVVVAIPKTLLVR